MFSRSKFPIFVLFCSFSAFSLPQKWKRSLKLDEDGNFWTHWNVQDDVIIFKVEVQTKGHVQFGLSNTVKLDGSDIITGWIKDGYIFFQDRHGEDNSLLPIDAQQDWELISGHENDTHTVLEFQRKLDSCDDDDDIDIDENSLHLMYAFSDDDPNSPEEVSHHRGRKGSRRARLLEPLRREAPTENLLYWDFRSENMSVIAETESVYWCTTKKAPELSRKHHIIKLIPFVQPGHERYVHHLNIYECDNSEREKLEAVSKSGGDLCSNLSLNEQQSSCSTLLFSWAMGMESLTLPENVGIPLKESPANFYMLEAHYTLRPLQKITDNSGVRISYTPNLKKYDAGTVAVGTVTSARFFIPPGQPSYVVAGHSHPKCFDPEMQEGKVRIFGSFLHAHLLARGMKVRHFRENVELPPVFENKNFDYHHQEYIMLREEVDFMKGDQLTLECDYDSSGKNETTYGGFTTNDEMCIAFIFHYPAIDRAGCMSAPTLPLVKGLLDVDMHDYMDTGYPKNFRELDQVDWSNFNMSLVQNTLRYSLHDVHCVTKGGKRLIENEKISYPAKAKAFVKENSC